MNVYELKIKIFLLKNIKLEETSTSLTRFLDMCMANNEELLNYHKAKSYKNYTFDLLYPLCKEGIYEKEQIYTFRLRTINSDLASYLTNKLSIFHNDDMKGLIVDISVIPKKIIEKIYTLTPVVMKSDGGYWKYSLDLKKFEERLRINSIKKYRYFIDKNMEDTVQLYNSIVFKNKKPVPVIYKNITLRGDKLELSIANDKNSQNLAYMLLGTGLLENCSRGCGFLTYKFY